MEYRLNKVIAIPLLLTPFIVLNSCVSKGSSFEFNESYLKINETKREEVLKNIGPPEKIFYLNNQEIFHYSQYKGFILLFYANFYEVRNLYVAFSENKTVSSYTYYSNLKKDKQLHIER